MSDLDDGWLLLCGFIVYFMQAGFAMVECGAVKSNSAVVAMIKNIGDSVIISTIWYLIGYKLAFGSGSGFIGLPTGLVTLEEYPFFFFQSTFACTAMTIVSGCFLERTAFGPYFLLTIWMGMVIYPVIAHWVWSSDGWLAGRFIDFAGGAVVHVVGGLCGLLGTMFVGPRGSFVDWKTENLESPPFRGQSVIFSGLGTVILWFGFYAFNAGSTLGLSNGASLIAGKVAINTTLSGASSCLSAILFDAKKGHEKFNVGAMFNGALAGLVAITSGCASMLPWAAILTGSSTGILYRLSAKLLWNRGIDDPIEAVSVHMTSGIWGCVCTGILANSNGATGIIGGNYLQLAWQLAGLATIVAYCTSLYLIGLFIVAWFLPIRVTKSVEKQGLDTEVGFPAHSDIGEALAYFEQDRSFAVLLQNRNSEMLWLFHAFVEKEFASEHLDFVLAVDDYLVLAQKVQSCRDHGSFANRSLYSWEQELIDSFQGICKRYVEIDSHYAVNISSHSRKAILKQLSLDIPRIGVFDAARQEVIKVLKSGPWIRFQETLQAADINEKDAAYNLLMKAREWLQYAREKKLQNESDEYKSSHVESSASGASVSTDERIVSTKRGGKVVWKDPNRRRRTKANSVFMDTSRATEDADLF